MGILGRMGMSKAAIILMIINCQWYKGVGTTSEFVSPNQCLFIQAEMERKRVSKYSSDYCYVQCLPMPKNDGSLMDFSPTPPTQKDGE